MKIRNLEAVLVNLAYLQISFCCCCFCIMAHHRTICFYMFLQFLTLKLGSARNQGMGRNRLLNFVDYIYIIVLGTMTRFSIQRMSPKAPKMCQKTPSCQRAEELHAELHLERQQLTSAHDNCHVEHQQMLCSFLVGTWKNSDIFTRMIT